jgi:hypothetical protein
MIPSFSRLSEKTRPDEIGSLGPGRQLDAAADPQARAV